jgi:Arc/MetJ-type ribon-helix-helix transcriptional regulator
MEIRLRLELEELIKQDVQRSAYETVDEFVEQAVSMPHEQEAWLAANRAEIQTKIAEKWASAQRGDLLSPDEARSKLADLRRARSTSGPDVYIPSTQSSTTETRNRFRSCESCTLLVISRLF